MLSRKPEFQKKWNYVRVSYIQEIDNFGTKQRHFRLHTVLSKMDTKCSSYKIVALVNNRRIEVLLQMVRKVLKLLQTDFIAEF